MMGDFASHVMDAWFKQFGDMLPGLASLEAGTPTTAEAVSPSDLIERLKKSCGVKPQSETIQCRSMTASGTNSWTAPCPS